MGAAPADSYTLVVSDWREEPRTIHGPDGYLVGGLNPFEARRLCAELNRLAAANQRHPVPTEAFSGAHDEALEWIMKNTTAIRRDNGNMDYSLGAMIAAYEANPSHYGWFYESDDGTEWSEDHPIESGGSQYAVNVRKATLAESVRMVLDGWSSLAESARESELLAIAGKGLREVVSDCKLAASACDSEGPRKGFEHIERDATEALRKIGWLE